MTASPTLDVARSPVVVDAMTLSLSIEAPSPVTPDVEAAYHRPPASTIVANVVAVVVPFLGLIAAVIMIWHSPFSWLNLSMFFGGYVITTLGITLGYHRLFTHRSFKAGPVVSGVLGVLGSMAIQGSILQWVSTHRRHHQHTDAPDDPHSPHAFGDGFKGALRGMYHSHLGWFFTDGPDREAMNRYVPDLLADPVVRSVSKYFGMWAILSLIIPAVVGLAVTGTWFGALMALLWGGLLRVFFVHHVTFSVNSVCHLWGRQPFNTHDESRNNLVMGILAMGEGWHNTHHAFPASARHGLAWWELDVSYWLIRAMAAVGLARDVRLPPADRVKAKRRVK